MWDQAWRPGEVSLDPKNTSTQAGPPLSYYEWIFTSQRGGEARREAREGSGEQKQEDPAGKGPWIFRFGMKILFQAAKNGFAYCGTLCASLGLAARWTYWLATGVIVVFLLQLLVWTYTWVIYPSVIHSRALWRYCRGSANWCEVSQLLGDRPFRPNWKGPRATTPWSTQYIQTEVRGRGGNRLPYDLLVTDGTAMARLRHGTVRGRTNRHGFTCNCDEVRSSSHRYYRNLLEATQCVVHLCSSSPCGAEHLPYQHVSMSAIVPQEQEVDLSDLAGRGPWGRCANLTWLFGLLWCRGCRKGCSGLWKGWIACCCFCCRRRPRRAPRPDAGERTEPRHDDSETESEAADGQACQADQIAIDRDGRVTPLSCEPCRDISRGHAVPLLRPDEAISCHTDLELGDDGVRAFYACDHHKALYVSSRVKRGCAVEGCPNVSTGAKDGVKLCRMHAAKGEKPQKGEVDHAPIRKPPKVSATSPEPPLDIPQLLAEVLQRVIGQETPAEALRNALSEHSAWQRHGTMSDIGRRIQAEALGYIERASHGADPEVLQALHSIAVKEEQESDNALEEDPVLRLLKTTSSHRNSQPVPTEQPQGPRGVPLPDPGVAAAQSRSHVDTVILAQEEKRGLAESMLRRRKRDAPPASIQQTSRALSGLEAFRPFHAGAYTDPSAIYTDEATKALQAIAKAVGAKDEASGQERGKLSSIGKTEERAVFLVRGCDTLTVGLGEATVGKELFHSLRNMATQSRPLLRALKFPVNITNRFAFGVASLAIGGRGQLADYALTSADFPQTSEEDFDTYSPPPDNKLERRPRPPTSLSVWFRCALRQAWALACVFGTEHYGSWEEAAGRLLKLGEEHAHAWPLQTVLLTWDELWGRFCEELRDLERRVRREMSEECPSFERVRFFATAPGPDGDPWLRLPRTFDLEDPTEYFQTDILPRQKRLLDRACWNLALKRGPVQGGKAGEGPRDGNPRSVSDPGAKAGSTPSHPQPLMGKPLTNKEVGRSMDHRPKCSKTHKYLCWDHMSRRGCGVSNCPHSHQGGTRKWDTLDYSIQMQLLRRGGHPQQPKPSGSDEVDRQIDTIRKEIAAKAAKAVEEGKAAASRAKAKAKAAARNVHDRVGNSAENGDPAAETRAGWAAPPPELADFAPTDQEEGLANLFSGQSETWTANKSAPPLRTARVNPTDAGVEPRQHAMRAIEQSHLVPEMPPLLGTYIRNRLLHVRDRPPCKQDVQAALDDALRLGSPELLVEAESYLSKVGSAHDRATLSPTDWSQGLLGHASLNWKGYSWDVYDYGDQLDCPDHRQAVLLPHDDPKTGREPRQCLVLHTAAAVLLARNAQLPEYHAVIQEASQIRDSTIRAAQAAEDALGSPPPELSRAEDDLRIYIHDTLYFGHDKDYRSLCAFPPESLDSVTLHIMRLDSPGNDQPSKPLWA